jgi:hypothetical protein
LDEDRHFFLQNLWYSQGLRRYGYVKGGGSSTFSQSKRFFGNTAYISDGYRAVLWVSEEPIPLDAVEVLDWEIPPEK